MRPKIQHVSNIIIKFLDQRCSGQKGSAFESICTIKKAKKICFFDSRFESVLVFAYCFHLFFLIVLVFGALFEFCFSACF